MIVQRVANFRIPLSIHTRVIAARHKVARLLDRDFSPYPREPEGSHLSPSEQHVLDYADAPLRYAWHTSDIADVREWQRITRAKLVELTGYARQKTSPETRVRHDSILPNGFVRRSYIVRTRERQDIPVHLVFDAAIGEPRPVMICLQGTNSGIHLSWDEIRMPADAERIARGSGNALAAAERGYLAVAIEQSCFGQRRERKLAKASPDPCIDAATHAMLLGRTMIGERAADISATIDWLLSGATDIAIDPARLHIVGNSTGGTMALFSAAMDTRIGAIIAGSCVGFMRETIGVRGDVSGQNIIPGILDWMEIDDIVGLCAPRPMLIYAGDTDHIWPFSGARKVTDSARYIYEAFGSGEALRAISAKGGHRYYPELYWPAFEALMHKHEDTISALGTT